MDLHGKKLTALKDLDKVIIVCTMVVLAAVFLQFGALRVLDASCNNLTKIEGLDRNKVMQRPVDIYYTLTSLYCLYIHIGTERTEALWQPNH